MFNKQAPTNNPKPPRSLGVAQMEHTVIVKVDDTLMEAIGSNKNPTVVAIVAFTVGYLLGKR